ncbi:hypothetical protein ACWT_2901 [Actinoplanes sp. SE50]|uniref:hypothetical protein n=1 Tax=unclassified Actinoplanes TaxID=2626549 RepID=UPI00023EC0B0|nr:MULTISPECIES: hypothetical protein [unclassified Actinoplanes]AEV83540.1 hypothetical protein ACPL_2645 [Actinoplanes sp. SE50/110]ATO82316.1 hypothetical protein ACWT_2901 [Actinoplanes sp. SE50]SLL99723.1 hypothetical protein ACSP50_2954 [Actinoplanes sp. SE50/110]
MYRQGDVLIVPVPPAGVPACAPVPRDPRGRMVLARGEATGHAHVVGGPGVRLVADLDDPERMFVEVPAHGRVSHEEHGPIALPSGVYRVIRQREYVPGAFRPVAD